jgi:single-stranded DNA-binding protein
VTCLLPETAPLPGCGQLAPGGRARNRAADPAAQRSFAAQNILAVRASQFDGPALARREELTAGKGTTAPGRHQGGRPSRLRHQGVAMNPISITLTGRLGDDPRKFTTRDGTAGVELRLAVEVPSRGTGDSITRWVKVTAFGNLASRTAASVGKGDRVTVIADDLRAEAWPARDSGEPRATVALRACEIAASMAFDELRTGYATRKAQRLAAASGEPTDLPAHEQAEAQVLAGVTTTS